jgi:hypothetical protein
MRKVCVVIVSLMLTACASLLTPTPVESEYFTTLGGGFMMTLGAKPSMRYGVNLHIKKELPAHTYAVIEFENPANKWLPYRTEGSIEEIHSTFAGRYKNVFVFNSPSLQGVKRHSHYMITLSIYSDASQQVLVTRHEQRVSSSYIGD